LFARKSDWPTSGVTAQVPLTAWPVAPTFSPSDDAAAEHAASARTEKTNPDLLYPLRI